MKKPLVSIIIPVLNNLKRLQESIESIQNQSFSGYEVWIIDGNSDNETKSYLQELKLPFQFISEKDNGIYDAMNKGIHLAKGEWLYFLGSGDVFFNENVLESIFKTSMNKNCQILSGRVLYKGENQTFIYSRKKKEKVPSWSFLMWFRNGLHHQGTFYNSELFKVYKYFLHYQILSDYWLNLSFFKKRFSCEILSTVIAVCDSNGVSKQKQWKIYKEEIQLKTELSNRIFQPFFYLVSLIKFTFSKF